VAYALRREMGEAAANILLQNGHENKIYDITGSELYAYDDIAKALSEYPVNALLTQILMAQNWRNSYSKRVFLKQ
jgi:uncharacterized protein YbjT (DUF2867 family)